MNGKVKLYITEKRDELILSLLCFAAGFCGFSGGFPFAVSIFLASDGARSYMLVSCFLSAALNGSLSVGTAAAYLFAFLFKLIFVKNKKSALAAKCVGSSICSALLSYTAFISAQTLYERILSIIAFLAVPLFTFLLCGFFEKSKKFGEAHYEAALLAAAFIAVRFFAPIELYGINLGFILAFTLTLCGAKRDGMLAGGVFGLCCGLALGAQYLAALGVGGLCFGLIAGANEKAASVVAFFAAACTGIYFFGILELFPCLANLLAGALIFSAVSPRISERVSAKPFSVPEKAGEAEKALAEAFFSLSDKFSKLSDIAAEDTEARLRKEVKSVFESLCRGCRCPFDRDDMSLCVAERLKASGFVSKSNMPSHFSSCKKSDALIEALNSSAATIRNRAPESIKRSAEDYFALSRLLKCSLTKENDDLSVNPALSKKAHTLLWGAGVRADKVKVRGKRNIEIEAHGVEVGKIHLSPAEIAGMLSTLTGNKLSEPEFVLCDSYATMILKSMPKFRAECARSVSGKSGEKVCGDSASFFESGDKRFFALISDGMGSGSDAALSSRLASVFLEKLLAAGADKRQSLIMLNRLLLAQQSEVFTTIDLLEIDLIRGTATIIKAGAAPSFIVRDGTCIKICSKTPPAGIIGEVYAEQTTIRVRDGDMIILFSDGLSGADGEASEIERYITSKAITQKNTAVTATKLLTAAKGFSKSSDDMTVCVIKLFAA